MAEQKSANVTKMPAQPKARTQIVKLSEPLETLDGTVSEIELREPRAGLVLKYGQPYRTIMEQSDVSDATRMEVQYIPNTMLMFIENMSGIDANSLEDLNASDMNQLFVAVLTLLQPAGN